MTCPLDQLPIMKVSAAQHYINSTKGNYIECFVNFIYHYLVSEAYWSDSFEIPYWL